MLDQEKVEWFADLMIQASHAVTESPCLIVEVDGNAHQWEQVLPQPGDDSILSGYLINLPYRALDENPITHFHQLGIQLPETASLVECESTSHATLRVGPNVSPDEIAHFIGATLEKAQGAVLNPELSIRIEFGY